MDSNDEFKCAQLMMFIKDFERSVHKSVSHSLVNNEMSQGKTEQIVCPFSRQKSSKIIASQYQCIVSVQF